MSEINFKVPKVGIMFDIESLALGVRPVITQAAMVGFVLDDPDDKSLEPAAHHFLPIDPQLQLIPPRKINGDTIVFWMSQAAAARDNFAKNVSDDFEELPSLMRHLIRTFNRMTNSGTIPYEIWARGPQFDIAAIETLLEECGLKAPWKYDTVRDLRTLIALSGIDIKKDVPEPEGFVKHDAYWDCVYQIACYYEATKQLRSA